MISIKMPVLPSPPSQSDEVYSKVHMTNETNENSQEILRGKSDGEGLSLSDIKA